MFKKFNIICWVRLLWSRMACGAQCTPGTPTQRQEVWLSEYTSTEVHIYHSSIYGFHKNWMKIISISFWQRLALIADIFAHLAAPFCGRMSERCQNADGDGHGPETGTAARYYYFNFSCFLGNINRKDFMNYFNVVLNLLVKLFGINEWKMRRVGGRLAAYKPFKWIDDYLKLEIERRNGFSCSDFKVKQNIVAIHCRVRLANTNYLPSSSLLTQTSPWEYQSSMAKSILISSSMYS